MSRHSFHRLSFLDLIQKLLSSPYPLNPAQSSESPPDLLVFSSLILFMYCLAPYYVLHITTVSSREPFMLHFLNHTLSCPPSPYPTSPTQDAALSSMKRPSHCVRCLHYPALPSPHYFDQLLLSCSYPLLHPHISSFSYTVSSQRP